MKKTDMKKLFAFGAIALASSFACAQTASAPTSSVQLWGIVDMAYRHTNNEGAANCHDPCGSPWMMEDTGGVRASAGRGRSIL